MKFYPLLCWGWLSTCSSLSLMEPIAAVLAEKLFGPKKVGALEEVVALRGVQVLLSEDSVANRSKAGTAEGPCPGTRGTKSVVDLKGKI